MSKIAEAFLQIDALDLKVRECERELAQWLIDHPQYSAPVVAGWVGCGETRIKQLRRWAQAGFDEGAA
jgi:hypothetical protein